MRIRPDLSDPRLMRLFYLGTAAHWTSRDYPNLLPDGWDQRRGVALAHLLTPVYLGEQSAMHGANSAIAYFQRHNQSAQTVYLATFMLDEARHLEVLTRLYELLGTSPLGIRELPDMLRYHHRMRAGGRIAPWVMGILISDIFAKHFYRAISQIYRETPLGEMATRVIIDESRHQAFAEHYLRTALPKMTDDGHRELWDLKEDLLQIVGRMADALEEDAQVLDLDGHRLFEQFREDVFQHCQRVGLRSRCRLCPYAGEAPPNWSTLVEGGASCACTSLLGGGAPVQEQSAEEEGAR